MRTKRAQKRTFKKQKGKEKKKKIGYAFISLRGGIWCHLVARNVSGRSEQTEAQLQLLQICLHLHTNRHMGELE